MSQNTFTPQRTLTIEKIMTPLAVLVVLVGIILVIVGPVVTMINGVVNSVSDAATEIGGGGSGAIVTADEGGAASTEGLLTRQLLPYTIIPDRPRDEVETYTVKPGDTLLAIAEQFGITPETIVWANNHQLFGDVHMLQRGMDLFILPTEGAYHRSYNDKTIAQIAEQYNVEPETILDARYNPSLTDATINTKPGWGQWIVIPGGEGETADLYKPVITETVDEDTGTVTRSFMPGMPGSCAAGIRGSGGTGAFSPPMINYVFTQGYYPGHSGVDLAAPVGSPVLATDTGIVIFSGWVNTSWGYGILVVLDHGNGWTSYYAHLNNVSVGCGQLVGRGGQVGSVGSTGNSSGPHLHFELRYNHIPDNPGAYVGF